MFRVYIIECVRKIIIVYVSLLNYESSILIVYMKTEIVIFIEVHTTVSKITI